MSTPLTQTQFDVLCTLMDTDAPLTQRELKDITGSSFGRANTAIHECETFGYIADRTITQAGLDAFTPYKVDNVIILVAGILPRSVPISYECPEGTPRVRGETLIERQICQL